MTTTGCAKAAAVAAAISGTTFRLPPAAAARGLFGTMWFLGVHATRLLTTGPDALAEGHTPTATCPPEKTSGYVPANHLC